MPYICPNTTGSVAGLVGAGGNLGGVIFLLFISEKDYKTAFTTMGYCIMSCSVLVFFVSIKGHAGFIFGSDSPEVLVRRDSASRRSSQVTT